MWWLSSSRGTCTRTHCISFTIDKMMWAPLFLAPWAATCFSKKIGLQVSLLFMAAHYGFRRPILNAVSLLLNEKNHSITTKKNNGSQTDTETAKGSAKKSKKGARQMEAHEQGTTQALQREAVVSYNCYHTSLRPGNVHSSSSSQSYCGLAGRSGSAM